MDLNRYMLTFMICSESFLSLSGSGLSTIRKIRSNLERMALEIFVFSLKDLELLYRPEIGLAEAMIPTLHFN